MNEAKLQQYEQILGHRLSETEKQRILQMKNIFEIHDNDALWDIILIMEYYSKFCLDVPTRIEDILKRFPDTATLSNAVPYTNQEQTSRPPISSDWVLWAIAFFIFGYMFAKNEVDGSLHIAQYIFASISFLLCVYYSKKYLQTALSSDKIWIKYACYALLSLFVFLFAILADGF